MSIPWKVIFCCFFGNVLETYDFLLFGIFAPVITRLFFPESTQGVLMTFIVFASGFILRPLGAIFIGSVGDRLGRKRALYLSAGFMSLSTICMGCLPTYDQWGLTATIFLILCRFLQGLSAGGEYVGAVLLSLEHSPSFRGGITGSLITVSTFLGSLLAVGVAHAVTLPHMPVWGWRMAFWGGIIIGILSVYIRLKIMESPVFCEISKKKKERESSFSHILKTYYRQIGLVIGMYIILSVLGYTFFVYIGIHLREVLKFSTEIALQYSILSLSTFIIMIPIMGWISDRLSPTVVMSFGIGGVILSAYPFYDTLQTPYIFQSILSLLIFCICGSAFIAPANAVMAQLFPIQSRYSGMALGSNMAIIMFGGMTPVINTYLTYNVGVNAPSFYIIVTGILGFISILSAKKFLIFDIASGKNIKSTMGENDGYTRPRI